MRREKVRFLATLLIEILLFSGCSGKTVQDVAELIEPVAANAAYRPVELGTIGETKVLYGTVAPMEYCCFYDTTVNIERIAVDVGDYVEEGDVIAYADINVAKEELESLTLQLENLNQNYELNLKISQLKMAQSAAMYESEIESLWNTVSGNVLAGEETLETDVSGNDLLESDLSEIDVSAYVKRIEEIQAQKKTVLTTAQENLRYDEILHDYRINKSQEERKHKQEIIAEGTLRATHSGYVVYVKNLGVSTYASAYENIVVLADSEETYIELADKTIDKYGYKDYEVKYLQLAGETYDVTELSYGTEAELLAKASGRYPNVRLSCPEAPKLILGETYPIFYREKKTEEVPIIGLDSLKGEEDAYFVYVKGEEGEREKRFVTIGESDKYYVQILSGLKEGELVYYESEARMPAEYTEYTVELSDYTIDNISRLYQLADEQVIWYDAECGGTITEFAVKKGDEVEPGKLLYVMRSDAGKAALAAALNDINRENTTYEETIKRLDKSFSSETDEIAGKILGFQKELEKINHVYRLRQLEKTYNDMAKNNDGNGKIYVYARQSGTVTQIEAGEEAEVIEGSHVLSIANEASNKLSVEMTKLAEERNYPDNIAEFGENITITVGDSVYEGVCTGWTAYRKVNKYYITVTEDGPQISFCTDSGYANPAFYVEMEDESFYQNMPKAGKVTFSYVSMEDVIAVPTALVKEETNAKNPTRTDHFVWCIVGDELVKQYVLINETYSDENMTLILSGVEAQDVLAWEK